MDRRKIRDLTLEYGGEWGLRHVDRVLKLIEVIGAGLDYNHDLLWLAAHLHDWGAYPAFIEDGKDHAIRSGEVAADILAQWDPAGDGKRLILAAIVEHAGAGECSSMESTLLREADYLDFMGIIGIARDFAKGPKDLRKCLAAVKKRMRLLAGLTLPKAVEIGRERLGEMEEFIAAFERESFGSY